MKVGWLHDNPGYLGGAELTMREFRAAAPEGVEVVECPPGLVESGLDRYVVGNCMSYPPDDFRHSPKWGRRVVRYHHDVARGPADDYLDSTAQQIFCSPLQREYYVKHLPPGLFSRIPAYQPKLIPPALDLDHFRRYANQNHREGAVCVGRMAYGKGLEFLAEYPEPVDVYSSVPIASEGNARYRGSTEDAAATLSRYQRFVFLPTAIEPFGRAVVEAWAAGCDLVVNRNVGARYWIEENPKGLETAAEDFWRVVMA